MIIEKYQYKNGDYEILSKCCTHERTLNIFKDNYINSYSTKELRSEYGITRQRISQILNVAIRRINKQKYRDDTVQEGEVCGVLKEGEKTIKTDEQKTCCKAHETD
jgi:hypothetical protein